MTNGNEPMLAIGEFARAAGLSVSAVRFYADRGVLEPSMTDAETGYRYFSKSQLAAAALVRDLRRIDMPLAEVAEVMSLAPADRSAAIAAQLDRLERRWLDARIIAETLGAAKAGAVEGSEPASETTVRSAELQRAISQVIPMAGIDPRAPHLMGVLIEVREGSVRLVATDRYRLTVRDFVPETAGDSFSAVLAAEALGDWRTFGDAETISLRVSGSDLVARYDGGELRCPVVPIEFPGYQDIIDRLAPPATSVVVERAQLVRVLDMFDGEEAVSLAAAAGELAVSRSPQASACVADISGPDVEVLVNPRFAADAVEHAVGSEVVVEIDDTTKPHVFRSADDGTYTSLLMPVAP